MKDQGLNGENFQVGVMSSKKKDEALWAQANGSPRDQSSHDFGGYVGSAIEPSHVIEPAAPSVMGTELNASLNILNDSKDSEKSAEELGFSFSSLAIGSTEREFQNQVVGFFKSTYMGYEYLGNKQKESNSNVEETLLEKNLIQRGYSKEIAKKAVYEFVKVAGNSNASLYESNKAVYAYLRYGIHIKISQEENNTHVNLIDWDEVGSNHFSFAEEVTVKTTSAGKSKRPDLVLYVNGIALVVLELKSSLKGVEAGVRQNLDNQKSEFIQKFFNTIQLVIAANQTQGVRYGTIETNAKSYLEWQEDARNEVEKDPSDKETNKLVRHLSQICSKDRLLELIRDFILFDAGKKKVCRQNQYFAIKATQKCIKDQVKEFKSSGHIVWKDPVRTGGIIWHTQGSGKSLTMAMLWRWIQQFDPQAKLVVLTDRKELDEQICKVFTSVKEGELANIYRAKSGTDLMNKMASNEHQAICSLIHKFGSKGDESETPEAVQKFIQEMRENAKLIQSNQNFYVYIDECHRTQSGELHKAMKASLPNAMFIGFTGTPLLQEDRNSVSVFGPYLHKYLFKEAVRDGVVLDLRYEAREIEQRFSSEEKINQRFDKATETLSPLAKKNLIKVFANRASVLSSSSRIAKISADIGMDFEMKVQLQPGSRGNAILVANSVYDACLFYKELEKTDLKGKIAVVTSFNPSLALLRGESTGSGVTENEIKQEVYASMISKRLGCTLEEAPGKAEEFETKVKKMFVETPEQMKLIIVVDKLLTGFDAPSATFLYIDKPMENHGLFQAICRTNRPDPDDETKEYGYIVDYRNLFGKIEGAMKDYSSDAFSGYDPKDVDGLLKDYAGDSLQKIKDIQQELHLLFPNVKTSSIEDLMEVFQTNFSAIGSKEEHDKEQKRLMLYKRSAAYFAAVHNMGSDLDEIAPHQAANYREESKLYVEASNTVKVASGDYADRKIYEPIMRRLIDQYVEASDSKIIEGLKDVSMLEIILRHADDIETAPDEIKELIGVGKESIIEANVRAHTMKDPSCNTAVMLTISEQLTKLMADLKKDAIDYKAFLRKVAEMMKELSSPELRAGFPKSINTDGIQVLYRLCNENEADALSIEKVLQETMQGEWRTHFFRRRRVFLALKAAIYKIMKRDFSGISAANLDQMVDQRVNDVMLLAETNKKDYPL